MADKPICIKADEWTALFDRRSCERTWLGGDGIYAVDINGNDSYASADENTKSFFIFSDTLMGSADENGNVYFAPGQPSQTSAVLKGNKPVRENIEFVWGIGGNREFGQEQHLFGEHKWMLDCFYAKGDVYILGFPEKGWKPAQMDMIKIPVINGNPDYSAFSKTADIKELHLWDDSNTYLYAFGIGILNNSEIAQNLNPDGYIYFYGYRDAIKEGSRKDLIVARLKYDAFPDFSGTEYFDGEKWVKDIEKCAVILKDVSCEMSVTPIPCGKYKGKYIAVYTKATESPDMMYAIGETPVGPFSKPVKFYHAPEHGLDNGGRYTYNAKAYPHLSSDGKLLISYNANNSNTFGRQTSVDYHPRFLYLDLEEI